MILYIYGCATCGSVARQTSRVLKYCRENQINLEIKYSSYNLENRAEHIAYLKQAGLRTDGYPAIVVEENNKVTRVKEWNL